MCMVDWHDILEQDEMLSKILARLSLFVCDLLKAVAFLCLKMSSFVSFLTSKISLGCPF